jgi:cell wall-associated NlpC family hydrolase
VPLVTVPQRLRPALACLITVILVAALLPVGANATPGAAPAPTVAYVTAQLDALARQAERLAEQYNKAQIDVSAAQRVAAAAKLAAAAAATVSQAAQDQLAATVLAKYEGGSFSATGALLTSTSGTSYLDQLNTLDAVARQQATVLARVTSAQAAADAAGRKARALLHDTEARRSALSEQRSQVANETNRYQALLGTLSLAQQSAYVTRQVASPAQIASLTAVHAGSAAAQRAVDFALRQLGKPYVFGAAGPDAFDCSGLTMAAWAAGGVSLPHLASSQYDYGTRVSASQLQPGDLIFLYQPIGHVSIYIGNGMLVSAPQPGENVQIVPFAYFAADFVGATRLA